MNLLADFVRTTRAEKGYTLVEVSRQSGGQISDGYVSRIENGVILPERVTPRKLSALARGLHVAEDVVRQLASGKKLSGQDASETQLLTYYQQLPPASQEDLLGIARALHRLRGIESAKDIRVKRPRAA